MLKYEINYLQIYIIRLTLFQWIETYRLSWSLSRKRRIGDWLRPFPRKLDFHRFAKDGKVIKTIFGNSSLVDIFKDNKSLPPHPIILLAYNLYNLPIRLKQQVQRIFNIFGLDLLVYVFYVECLFGLNGLCALLWLLAVVFYHWVCGSFDWSLLLLNYLLFERIYLFMALL